MNVYIPYTRLPSEYQEVEYIETTGTQYITTSITPSTNIQVEVKIEVATTAMDKTIFGTNRGSTYYHLTPYSNAWYYGLNGGESHAGTYSNVVGTQYEVVYNNSNSQLSINGTEVGSTSGTTSTNPLEIAKRASDNTKGVFKYFYFNVYNKSTSEYLLKLVPCYRKSDSVIGMYDLVNNQFYTNSGTGTFSKGNDVTMSEVDNIYIGEYGWKPGANTIAYYPLESDVNDYSGNNHNGTNNGVTFTALSTGKNVGVFSNAYIEIPDSQDMRGGTSWTQSFWFKYTSGGATALDLFSKGIDNDAGGSIVTRDHIMSGYQGLLSYGFSPSNSNNRPSYTWSVSLNGSWHNLIWTFNNGVYNLYGDGELLQTQDYSSNTYVFNTTRVSYISGAWNKYDNAVTYRFAGNMSDVIIENKVWSASDVANYYNQTKSNYGL